MPPSESASPTRELLATAWLLRVGVVHPLSTLSGYLLGMRPTAR